MVPLNLPSADFKVKKSEGKVWIFDSIRKKFVVLTPEEWVRQHFIHFLIQEYGYPKSLIRIESALPYNTLQKRSDILIYNRAGKPWMLIECKSPTVKLGQNAFNQAAIYNMALGARYLAVTNGMVHFCCLAKTSEKEAVFLDDFPSFDEDLP
ncbi:MAG: type I restriction enzyme HsdR N-terminal domain-containing protein [Cyclobacteriaceae bacterium]|nr:type I restriction enzyme HsdR N-terminal domain-containing protein [Cyclobacteriaceae bacterium]